LRGNKAFWCTFDVGVSPTSEKNSLIFHTAMVVSHTVLQQDTWTLSLAVPTVAPSGKSWPLA